MNLSSLRENFHETAAIDTEKMTDQVQGPSHFILTLVRLGIAKELTNKGRLGDDPVPSASKRFRKPLKPYLMTVHRVCRIYHPQRGPAATDITLTPLTFILLPKDSFRICLCIIRIQEDVSNSVNFGTLPSFSSPWSHLSSLAYPLTGWKNQSITFQIEIFPQSAQ
jgi:hypothetical protein